LIEVVDFSEFEGYGLWSWSWYWWWRGCGLGHALFYAVWYGYIDRVYRGIGCSLVALVGMVCMIANRFSNAKVFSLVNELRIIKKSNLLKFKLFWGC